MSNIEKQIASFRMKWESFLTGCDSIEEMDLWDKETLGEMDGFYTNDLTSIVLRIIAADGTITAREVEYLNRTFGFEYTLQALQDVYHACKDDIGHAFDENFENGITHLRKINSKLADAYKELLGLICDIIIGSDGIITETEAAEVQRLKAMCQ